MNLGNLLSPITKLRNINGIRQINKKTCWRKRTKNNSTKTKKGVKAWFKNFILPEILIRKS